MDFNERYGTDKVAEQEGVEVRLDDGCVIKVARISNRLFKAERKRLFKPHLGQMRRGTMDDDLTDDLYRKAVAKFVLIGWSGLTIGGKSVKYSPDKAEELMKQSEDFENDVLEAATTMETFRKEDVEEGAKNSEAS